MSDINRDYFEAGQELARARHHRVKVSNINSMLGEQGKKLLAYLEDLEKRNIGFSCSKPTLHRGQDEDSILIDFTCISKNSKTYIGCINIRNRSASFSVSASYLQTFISKHDDSEWSYGLAKEIAAAAIELHGAEETPSLSTPESTPVVH